MNANKLKIYSNPQEIKLCLLCSKEIDKKWKNDLCLSCRENVRLYPDKLKVIAEVFKITSRDKKPQKSGEGKMTKEKQKQDKTDKTEDKKIFAEFYESELSEFGLNKTAKRREFSNAVRKKLKMKELTTTRSGKRKEIIEKLGLPADATQKDINEAVLKLQL